MSRAHWKEARDLDVRQGFDIGPGQHTGFASLILNRQLLSARRSSVQNQGQDQSKNKSKVSHDTRRIITSVALIRAAAVCPGFNCISRAERAVMMDTICLSPIEMATSAIRPLMRTESIRPTS